MGEEELLFICDSCAKKFDSKKALDCHLRQAHNVSIKVKSAVANAAASTDISVNVLGHSVCIFVSCRGDEALSVKDTDFGASQIERNCFGGILLALCALKGTGDHRAITLVHPQSITSAEFAQAATEMECYDLWATLVDSGCVLTFSDSIALRLAFTNAAGRAAAYKSCLRHKLTSVLSLFIVGHGDFERLKVGFGERFGSDGRTQKKAFLMPAAEVSDVIEVYGADMVHVMTCKASKFVRTLLEKTKSIPGRHDRVLFLAYGDEDITTVPLVFASGSRRYQSVCASFIF